MRGNLFSILLILASFFGHAQPESFTSKGLGGGGALFSPSINPANNQEIYVSCDMSELFHSSDLGSTYDQVNFAAFTGGHDSKVNFTNVPGLLFSISYLNDVGTPVKSTDNGQSWAPLAGNPDPDENNYCLVVDYDNPNKVLISNYNQVYFSSNGGLTFSLIHTASNSGSGIVIAGSLFDGQNIYVGTNDGVLTSANGGTNWTVSAIPGIPSGEQIWSFTAAKQAGTTRFFCLTGNAGDIYAGMQGSDYYDFFKGIYSYDLGTSGWISKVNGISIGTDFPMFVKMAGNDIHTVYLAGSNTNGTPIVMKYGFGTYTWNHQFNTLNNQNIKTGWSGAGGDRGWGYGECPFGFEVASNNSNIVVFTDFGFCHKSTDGGASWEQAYLNKSGENSANALIPAKKSYQSNGLENTTSWQIHWTSATDLWACYSDIRALRSVDGGNSWSFNYSGHDANSMYRIAQGADGKLFAATSDIHDMYQSTRLQDNILDPSDAHGRIIYSSNDGQNWQTLHQFGHPVFWISIDPNTANRAYASVVDFTNGTGGVYRCNDLSALTSSTWTQLPSPPRTQRHPASLVVLNDGKLVATYSGRRAAGAFTASSGVFIYDPTANTWTDVSAPGMYYWTKDVVIDPNDPLQNTWYVSVFSGWGGAPNGLGGLYKTTNRGTSWTKLTGNILDRVTSCTFNPGNTNEIYLTTETQGLWMSKNISSTTPTFSPVTSYRFRQPERVFFNPYNINQMWVSSFGNGMKMGLLSDGPLPVLISDFHAVVYEKLISLTWKTTFEKDFDHFELERSFLPDKGFTTLAKIGSTERYLYDDQDVLGGIKYYYRLKSIDADGSAAISKIVYAEIQSDAALTIYPNPARKTLLIHSNLEISSFSIHSVSGTILFEQSGISGSSPSIALPELSTGLYIVKIRDANGRTVNRKLIIK